MQPTTTAFYRISEDLPNTIHAKSLATEKFIPSEVFYYRLSVKSDYGKTTRSGWYREGETATWPVTPSEVEMEGISGALGGKYKARNPGASVKMTGPNEIKKD